MIMSLCSNLPVAPHDLQRKRWTLQSTPTEPYSILPFSFLSTFLKLPYSCCAGFLFLYRIFWFPSAWRRPFPWTFPLPGTCFSQIPVSSTHSGFPLPSEAYCGLLLELPPFPISGSWPFPVCSCPNHLTPPHILYNLPFLGFCLLSAPATGM